MRTTVIYAPHPDDESLYLSGYIRVAALRGDRLVLVAVSDGGGSAYKPAAWTAGDLMVVRRAEQMAAWSALTAGASEVVVHRLGQTDGSIVAARVTPLAQALEDIYGPDVEHYVAGSRLTTQSADHQAVANGVAAAGNAVVRYAHHPGVSGGSLYNPAVKTECEAADDAYRAFGHTSVASVFATWRNSGYASRVFA